MFLDTDKVLCITGSWTSNVPSLDVNSTVDAGEILESNPSELSPFSPFSWYTTLTSANSS